MFVSDRKKIREKLELHSKKKWCSQYFGRNILRLFLLMRDLTIKNLYLIQYYVKIQKCLQFLFHHNVLSNLNQTTVVKWQDVENGVHFRFDIDGQNTKCLFHHKVESLLTFTLSACYGFCVVDIWSTKHCTTTTSNFFNSTNFFNISGHCLDVETLGEQAS